MPFGITRLVELKPLKNVDDTQSLSALPVLLSGIALNWHRGKKHEINSWSHFKVLFLERFVPFGLNFGHHQSQTSRSPHVNVAC